MDSDEVLGRLIHLGRSKFRSVVAVMLDRIFGFKVASVDAAGDAGSDWILFTTGGEKVSAAIQDTIQQQNWEGKAIEDAKKAKANGANRFFFVTNRVHQPIKIKPLESKITSKTGMSATVIDGRQLAELVVQGEFVDDFLEAIGEQAPRKRPAMPK